MNTTRNIWVILSCLAAQGAAGAPPRIGQSGASIDVISGDVLRSLPPARSVEEILYNTRGLVSENAIGEESLFTGPMRLRFDSLNPGDDSRRARLTGGIGYTENVQEQVNNGDNSSYYFLGGDFGTSLKNGPLDLLLAVGGTATYYDEDLDYRQDDENWVPDLGVTLGATYALGDSAVIKAYGHAYYGGRASVSRNFLKGGVTASNYFYWTTDLGADYRFDHAALGQRGVEWSSNFGWGGLEEDGDGSANNELDNFTLSFRQEGRYNFDERTTLFVEGRYNRREWEYHPMWNPAYGADSDSFRVGGGGRVQWADNFSWGAAAGAEFREYDDLPLNGDDSRTEFYINTEASWKATDSFSIGVYADYGIQDFHPNEGPVDAYIDPLGLRGGLRAHYQWNATTALSADWNLTRAHGSEVVNPMYDDWDFFRWACGLSLTHQLNDRVELFLAGEIIQLDNDQNDETYVQGGAGARVGF